MYKKILVALDGSELAEKGLGQAAIMAKENSVSEIVLLSVLDASIPGEGLTYGGTAYQSLQTQLVKKQEEEAQKYLATLVVRLKREGLEAKVEIRRGSAAEELISYAVENQVDLIVLTTHGRSGLSRFFIGSVAGKVIGSSPVPVLVIPPA